MLAENKEKISRDYKIMKHMICKGDEPAMMTIRISTGNPLIDNMNLENVETRLQKEIEKTRREQMTQE